VLTHRAFVLIFLGYWYSRSTVNTLVPYVYCPDNRVTFQAVISYEEIIENEDVSEGIVFKPNVRLQNKENELSANKKKTVNDNMVKETIVNTFSESMKTPEAQKGMSTWQNHWKSMYTGRKAPEMFETIGNSFQRIMTSEKATDIIGTLVSLVHVLLSKVGYEEELCDVTEVLKKTLSILSASNLPEIVERSGDLVNEAVNKKNANLFVARFFQELNNLLNMKNLDKYVTKNFANLKKVLDNILLFDQPNRKIKRV